MILSIQVYGYIQNEHDNYVITTTMNTTRESQSVNNLLRNCEGEFINSYGILQCSYIVFCVKSAEFTTVTENVLFSCLRTNPWIAYVNVPSARTWMYELCSMHALLKHVTRYKMESSPTSLEVAQFHKCMLQFTDSEDCGELSLLYFHLWNDVNYQMVFRVIG